LDCRKAGTSDRQLSLHIPAIQPNVVEDRNQPNAGARFDEMLASKLPVDPVGQWPLWSRQIALGYYGYGPEPAKASKPPKTSEIGRSNGISKPNRPMAQVYPASAAIHLIAIQHLNHFASAHCIGAGQTDELKPTCEEPRRVLLSYAKVIG
jgi:hypothetical protein